MLDSPNEFQIILTWLTIERQAYQTAKFDYEEEKKKDVNYWMQQFNSYLQRIPLFGIDTMQGQQAVLKLAATAIACAEHIAERIDDIPEPAHSSGDIISWRHPS